MIDTAQNFDDVKYRKLAPLADGFVPRIERRYQFKTDRCNFPVRIVSQHPQLPDYFHVQAVFAMNCLFVPDWAHASTLTALD